MARVKLSPEDVIRLRKMQKLLHDAEDLKTRIDELKMPQSSQRIVPLLSWIVEDLKNARKELASNKKE